MPATEMLLPIEGDVGDKKEAHGIEVPLHSVVGVGLLAVGTAIALLVRCAGHFPSPPAESVLKPMVAE